MQQEISGKAFILSGGQLAHSDAKTTHGLLRGTERFRILAVIDPVYAGQDAGVILDGHPKGIPVEASLQEALSRHAKPDYCIIGVATVGGILPPELAATVKEALSLGISVVNGLHDYLQDRPDMVALAASTGARLIDVRKPKPRAELQFWSESIYTVKAPVIAVLGMDCAMGKRTTARLLRDACRAAGHTAEMIYTGQTGWMQGNRYGFIFDSTLNDFVTGELAHAILQADREAHPDFIFLEGQSALRNPSGPCGAEFLVSGNAKQVVLIHAPKREFYDDHPAWGKIPSVASEIQLIELYGSRVIALALNTTNCSLEEAKQYQEIYHQRLGIPVVLPLEEGVDSLVPLLEKLLP